MFFEEVGNLEKDHPLYSTEKLYLKQKKNNRVPNLYLFTYMYLSIEKGFT